MSCAPQAQDWAHGAMGAFSVCWWRARLHTPRDGQSAGRQAALTLLAAVIRCVVHAPSMPRQTHCAHLRMIRHMTN